MIEREGTFSLGMHPATRSAKLFPSAELRMLVHTSSEHPSITRSFVLRRVDRKRQFADNHIQHTATELRQAPRVIRVISTDDVA